MRERQAAIALGILLVISVIFANESFAEKYQSNTKADFEGYKKDKEDSSKDKNWKKEKEKHDDDDDWDLKERDGYFKINNLQKQIDDLKNQLNDVFLGLIKWSQIQEVPEDLLDGDDDTLAEIKCDIDQIIKWNGRQWECIDDKSKLLSTIFFQHSSTSGGVSEWVGTTNQIFDERDSDKASFIIPFSGTLSNLMAKGGTSGESTNPGIGESIILTIIKNGVDTQLSCTISDIQTECINNLDKISIQQGDSIILRVDPSMNAKLVNIRISVILSP